MHVPPLFHAVILQAHVYAGSLLTESRPLQLVHTIEFMHPLQSGLQA